MKISIQFFRIGMVSALILLAVVSGCADKGPPPPPPNVAVVGFGPDYCFWDGYEYIGWMGYDYYYWAPARRVWVICDPARVQRADVWIQSHPDRRLQTAPTIKRQPVPDLQPRPEAAPPAPRHLHDRDKRRDGRDDGL